MGPSCGSVGKESTCNVGDLGSIPGLGRSAGEGKSYTLQYFGLENSMDCIVLGILQVRILEWVAVPFSRGSSQPRDQTQVSCIAGRFFTNWAIKAMTNLDSILKKSKDITLLATVRIVKAMAFPIVMYGCESWTIKKAEQMLSNCGARGLLRVPWTAR